MRGGLLSGVIVTVVALSVWQSSSAAKATLPADLAAAAADYDRAQIKGDAALLNRLLADDYHLVNGANQIERKQQFVAESIDPAFKLEPFTVENPIETVWPEGAVLAGEVHLQGQDHGKPFTAHFRFADVWRKRNGIWQVVFTEVTRFPAEKPAA
jgi:ketosteroid isomerase-like protein